MGIRFLDSILVLVAASLIVFPVYLVGHALSNDHATWAWIAAPLLLAAGAGLGWLTGRRLRSYAQERGERLHG